MSNSQNPSSSDSYNSRKTLKDHYQHFSTHFPKPNSHSHSVRHPEEATRRIALRSSDRSSDNLNSHQSLGTPDNSGYIQEIIPGQEASLVDLHRLGQKVQKQKMKSLLKGFEREAEEKAERLAREVLRHSEQMNDLKKKMDEKTETTKKIINEWYKMKKEELRMIRDGLLENLKSQEKLFFDNEKFYKEIEQAKLNIEKLNGDCTNIHEFYSSIVQAEEISKIIQEKREIIEELGNSLLETVNVKVFKENMESVVAVNEKAFMSLEFPEFVDKEKHERIPGRESVLTTRETLFRQNASLCESILSGRNLNFSNNLRSVLQGGQNQNNS